MSTNKREAAKKKLTEFEQDVQYNKENAMINAPETTAKTGKKNGGAVSLEPDANEAAKVK